VENSKGASIARPSLIHNDSPFYFSLCIFKPLPSLNLTYLAFLTYGIFTPTSKVPSTCWPQAQISNPEGSIFQTLLLPQQEYCCNFFLSVCPLPLLGGAGWCWWWRQIRNSYCKKNYKHQKKGPPPQEVQFGRRVRRVRPTLHTWSQGQKNLGPTWSIFGLQIGLKLLINARKLMSEYY